MKISQILDKICEQNDAIHGALVRSNDRLYHNFKGLYEMVDVANVADIAEQALMLTRSLEADNNEFNSVFFEYDDHSLLVKEIDAGLFILLTAPMERAVYKKTRVGVNLFIKKLCKALEQSTQEEASDDAKIEPIIATRSEVELKAVENQATDNKTIEEPPRKKRFYRGQFY
jgi:hypothetical protein